MLMLSEQVSKEVKVVLSGDGGDEFLGYKKYFQLLKLSKDRFDKSYFYKIAAKLLANKNHTLSAYSMVLITELF